MDELYHLFLNTTNTTICALILHWILVSIRSVFNKETLHPRCVSVINRDKQTINPLSISHMKRFKIIHYITNKKYHHNHKTTIYTSNATFLLD